MHASNIDVPVFCLWLPILTNGFELKLPITAMVTLMKQLYELKNSICYKTINLNN